MVYWVSPNIHFISHKSGPGFQGQDVRPVHCRWRIKFSWSILSLLDKNIQNQRSNYKLIVTNGYKM